MRIDYSFSDGMGEWPDTECRVVTVTLPSAQEVVPNLNTGQHYVLEIDRVVTLFYAPSEGASQEQLDRIDQMLAEHAAAYAFHKAVEQAQVMLTTAAV